VGSASWLDRWPGVRRQEPLAPHTYYGIGGPADYFLKVDQERILPALIGRLRESGIPYTPFGGGTNTLVLDGGLEGLVLQLATRWMRREGLAVVLSAGYLMPRAAVDTVKAGLSGLEFGAGVPGTVGGSVVGNAGAFGTEVKDVLTSTELLAPDGKVEVFRNAECEFGYRESRWKRPEASGWIVLHATFQLRAGDPRAGRATIQQIQQERRRTQPTERRSLGSVFKNPPGDAAGRLIEACGLKGMRQGGAQISPQHANFIVNLGGARASDVLALMEIMRDAVQQRFGVTLEPEIRVIGRAHH